MKMKIPTEIKLIMRRIKKAGFEAYIIGGAVRDWLYKQYHKWNIEPHDYDIFTNATGEQILKIFPNGNVIGGEERQKKILTVIVDGVEISQYRSSGDRTQTGKTLMQHQQTCDFHMNAIAVDINGEIVDNMISKQGRFDICNNYISFVGEAYERIKEDPLRLLRAIRFLAKYNLKFAVTIDREEVKCSNLKGLPPERIRDELIKIMEYENGLELLHEYKFLREIYPELYDENNFKDGGQHHDETPFEHMMLSFKQACKITTDYRVKVAATLHDIGKPLVREEYGEMCQDANGNEFESELKTCVRFHDHDSKGAIIAKEILKRLKFSNEDINFIVFLVKKHMFGYMSEIQDKTYVKFYAEMESNNVSIYDFLMVVYCDRQANLKKSKDKFGDFCKSSDKYYLLYHYNRIKSKALPFTIKDLAISGKDLIEGVGLKPGPAIGTKLKEIYDLVLEGELKNSRPELMYYIKTGEKE